MILAMPRAATRSRMSSLIAGVAVAICLAAAADAREMSREEALAALASPTDVEARRAGAARLGETGTMSDVPSLVQALRDADPEVRAIAEMALWQVWSRSGDAEIDRLFATGLEQMQTHHAEEAVETFTRIIERRPEFAEGWNKRATVYYLIGEYRKSLADCDEVIKRNPQHFGALSGYGLIYMRLDEPERALEYFERALRVNPNLDGVRTMAEALRQALIERRKQTY
jgi:tetratricopeptide (TPR) repeat protein